MKKILLFYILLFVSIMNTSAQDFTVDPLITELGNINAGDPVSFQIVVTHYADEPRVYEAFIPDHQYAAPWITSINPTQFSLSGYGETQTVTFTGTYPTDSYWEGYGTFYATVKDENQYEGFSLVKYTGVGDLGIEDWIHLSQWVSTFNEQDPLVYEAIFVDEDPYGDFITEWNLNITLSSTQGDYEYVDLTTTYVSNSWLWSFDAPLLPSNMSFIRNELGQVYGILTITALDNDGYYHYETIEIGINKIPDTPIAFLNRAGANSISTSYSTTGGPDYLIYYDTDPGPPYNGTGLLQGNSPIEVSNITSFQLDGAQECTPYYIAVKVSNDQGMSDYSVEKSIKVFDAPNNLAVNYHFEEYYVNESKLFDENHYFIGNLVIQSGVEVTFTGGFVYFEEDSKVIIEPGARLNIDGATFTAPCDQSWQGIEVWGITTAHQFPDANGDYQQGYLDLDNATIENAYNAVTLWKPDDWNSRGGIINANNSTFKNNRRSVEFMSYQNYHPYNGNPVGNMSSFIDCDFEVNDDYWTYHSSEFAYHISMWQVQGVSIRACDFINSLTSIGNIGYGIYTMDAGYKVQSTCASNITPCPEADIEHSTFMGFHAGIGALNSGTIYPFYVKDAVFDDNGYGIDLIASNFATLLNNEIIVGDNTTDASDCSLDFGVGIGLTNCNGYAVEENEFSTSSNMTGNSIGVFVDYQEGYIDDGNFVQNNNIYNNQYDGLHIANEALGVNRNDKHVDIGLQFLCNDNQNNTYDFYIRDEGIRLYQGTQDIPAGNEFSLNGNNPFSDYNNQAEWPIMYFHSGNPPVDYSDNVHPTFTQNVNTCMSNYGNGNNTQIDGLGLDNAQLSFYDQQYNDNLASYNGTLALYESLKDGGNTQTVIIEIETSWPDEMWALRADLLNDSPHLSMDVLYATADNTDVFPDAVIFEILSANPDEMRDEEFLTYLAEKDNPLPGYMIDILRGLAGNMSYKTVLQSQMSEYRSNMTQIANIIIRNMLNADDCDMDVVRNWVGTLGSIASDYQIINSYLQEGNTTDALGVLSLIPTEYSLTGDDLIEFGRYSDLKQLQATLISEGRNIFLLTPAEKLLLETIADNSSGQAGIEANNILAFVYGDQHYNCPQIPDPNTHKDFNTSSSNEASTEAELELFPNPARNWATFEYCLPANDGNINIVIYNVQGMKVHSMRLNGLKGQAVMDVRSMKPGVYHYILNTKYENVSGKMIIAK